jgi:hypothetical protein
MDVSFHVAIYLVAVSPIIDRSHQMGARNDAVWTLLVFRNLESFLFEPTDPSLHRNGSEMGFWQVLTDFFIRYASDFGEHNYAAVTLASLKKRLRLRESHIGEIHGRV